MSGRETPELAAAAVEGGADVIELGFPFSDPLADGPVIRRAAERALAEGMRTGPCLECLARTRELVGDVPLVPWTYSALLEAYGWDRFAADARAAGASSLIVADLPAGERSELQRVQLVAPTSTDERLRVAASNTDGWLYLVTLTGTTGARAELSPELAGLVSRPRAVVPLLLRALPPPARRVGHESLAAGSPRGRGRRRGRAARASDRQPARRRARAHGASRSRGLLPTRPGRLRLRAGEPSRAL